MLTKPVRLAAGDVVRVVSPSSAVAPGTRAQLDAGVAALESLGLRVQIPDDVFRRRGTSAGSAQERADSFMAAWLDPDVRMVLMSQGGQTANGLLDLLDYDAVARHPKVFMGMSDGTTLLTALSTRAGVVTFHGPDLLFGYGRPLTDVVLRQQRRVLFEAEAAALDADGCTVRRAGRATGPLVGGHSNILLATMLAGFEPTFDGAILFLEGTHPMEELERHLTILRLRGVFEQINGLVLGHFSGLAGPGETAWELVRESCLNPEVPVIEIGQLGHHVDNVVLPVGVPAVIDTDRGVFALAEPAVL